jgi:hypothetical protein
MLVDKALIRSIPDTRQSRPGQGQNPPEPPTTNAAIYDILHQNQTATIAGYKIERQI